jgi:hypothetical protein
LKNASGILVYSKQYTVPILFVAEHGNIQFPKSYKQKTMET